MNIWRLHARYTFIPNMQYFGLFSLFFLLIGIVSGSHYRGGSMSWTIRVNATTNQQQVPVRITQRHSWRRSAHFCNNTSPVSGNVIGEGALTHKGSPDISATVKCTDYNQEFDYSSGESSASITLAPNKRVEYSYKGCCWIPLLSPDKESDWSMQLLINTNPRSDGTWNNSPKTAMNPIVQVQIGKVHVIRIPMADSDGDQVRCRWGKNEEECGSICTAKGPLVADPCTLSYNASRLGYHAVALVIEDFDTNNNVLSAIPLQFLIHIVNATIVNNLTCADPPVYVGDRPQGACIGVESNSTVTERVQFRIPCANTSTMLDNILTISPAGMNKGPINRDLVDPNLYSMEIQWTPQPDQYGIQQLCLTPVDTEQQMGSQICFTFQVDVRPPEFVRMSPTGLVPATQAQWTIETDRDIVSPRRASGVFIRFFKRSDNQEVFRVDAATDLLVFYQPRQIIFYTSNYTWEQGEEYYILLDSGVATINESCGVESAPVNDPQAWVFRVAAEETTFSPPVQTTEVEEELITTELLIPETTQSVQESTPSTTLSTPIPRPSSCTRWFSFHTIVNASTSASEPTYTFCFSVNTTIVDATISANTWVPCMSWKSSGTADPLLELYTEPAEKLLAENDDGNGLAHTNCFAAVLSYRLPKGDYRVVIRNQKCAYGNFEIRLSAEYIHERK